jgi:hypothetical protein
MTLMVFFLLIEVGIYELMPRVPKVDFSTLAYTAFIYRYMFFIFRRNIPCGPVLGAPRTMSLVLTIYFLHFLIQTFQCLKKYDKQGMNATQT